jgi:hypothetical protein
VNTTLENTAAEYLDAVRDALADLPDAELADDVAEHFEQVTAELGGDASRAVLESSASARRSSTRPSCVPPPGSLSQAHEPAGAGRR